MTTATAPKNLTNNEMIYRVYPYLTKEQERHSDRWTLSGQARWTINPYNEKKLELVTGRGEVIAQIVGEVVYTSVTLESSPTPRHFGPIIENSATGTSHFVNSWDETLCGTTVEGYVYKGERRATCQRCCKSGDAARLNGYESRTGSPAGRM